MERDADSMVIFALGTRGDDGFGFGLTWFTIAGRDISAGLPLLPEPPRQPVDFVCFFLSLQ